jgi:2-methylisocitrate lyase-like PEP mutase family enzyme
LGKQIVDRETYYSRLRAAVAARDQLQSDMLIIARTDANQTYGFDEAIERLQEAVRIGVDILFFEAIKTREEAVKICKIFEGIPVLLNVVPGGVTPLSTVQEAREIGFRMVIYPGLCLEPFIKSVRNELQVLKQTGKASPSDPNSGIKDAFNLSGLQECIAIDKLAGGKAYAGVGD